MSPSKLKIRLASRLAAAPASAAAACAAGAVFTGFAVAVTPSANVIELLLLGFLLLPGLLLALADSRWLLPYGLAVWAVAPEVRRLYDWLTNTYHSMSLFTVVPLAVGCMLLIPTLGKVRDLTPDMIRGLCAMACALLYALAIGFARNGTASLYDTANTVVPMLAIPYAVFRRSDDSVFWTKAYAFTAAGVGLYGILQYFLVPPWDAFWMEHAGMTSIGKPEPLEIRVFSTLNSPGPAAFYLIYALAAAALLPAVRRFIGWAGMAAIALGLAATLVRSAWFVLVFVLAAALAGGKLPGRARGILVLLVSAAAVYGLLSVIPGGRQIVGRFETIGDLANDHSYNERVSFTGHVVNMVLSDPAGKGFGGVGLATKLKGGGALDESVGVFDSGIGHIFVTYGVPGAAAFFAAIGFWYRDIRARVRVSGGTGLFETLGGAVLLGSLANLLFAYSYGGAPGALIWFFVGMSLRRRGGEPHGRHG
ncbi:O-antigen ligase family protein [Paenibacillus thermoaerophilus]|uniref:O-antigen ligase family protein n=1 Tax=Paenibacillus thermoaerophilus TaxID=1215385 RepID=A0ABW2V6P9_9BACL|nr:O-antigen ligase family protein [Paenibacillus thermoaerophilus]TMV16161.1 O-antigen ligase family protein [Paenibacillus thermoaerophilus]